MKTYQVLSIDAWGNRRDGFEWNEWFKVGTVTENTLDLYFQGKKKEFLNALKDQGIVNVSDLRITGLDDDQSNIVLTDRKTQRPIIAIEYFREVEV